MTDLSNAVAGDEVWCPEYGWGKITVADGIEPFL